MAELLVSDPRNNEYETPYTAEHIELAEGLDCYDILHLNLESVTSSTDYNFAPVADNEDTCANDDDRSTIYPIDYVNIALAQEHWNNGTEYRQHNSNDDDCGYNFAPIDSIVDVEISAVYAINRDRNLQTREGRPTA